MGVRIPPGLLFIMNILRIRTFLKAVINEMKKVSWTGRKELLSTTVVVIILSVIVATIIGIMDLIFSGALKVLLGR